MKKFEALEIMRDLLVKLHQRRHMIEITRGMEELRRLEILIDFDARTFHHAPLPTPIRSMYYPLLFSAQ